MILNDKQVATMSTDNSTYNKLFALYGPMMQNKALYQAVGFNSYRVFYQHLKRGEVELNVFQIRGRKGWFARTKDVADWVDKLAECNSLKG